MDKSTPAQRKLISFLSKRNPSLSKKEIYRVLNSLKRFVILTAKIYTEPQARITYKDRVVGNKISKDRIFTTNMRELTKVMEKPSEPIKKVFTKFHKEVTKNKYD
jgi:hypothetical protein